MNRGPLARSLTRRVARDPLLCAIRELARGLPSEVWLCGGYLRDVALGRRPGDVDLLCTSGTSRLVGGLRELSGHRGFRFRKRGVTTWRFDVDGRKLDLVDASRRGLQEDLARRELTINAMAYRLGEPQVADPFRGLTDLEAGRLRSPRPGTFREDPARALRLARFVAELPGFRPTPVTLREARLEPRRMSRLPVERITPELDRLLQGPAAQDGLRLLTRLDLLDPLLPELSPLRHCRAGAERPDVWTHTIDAIELSAGRGRSPGWREGRLPEQRRILRWSLLLHDISKPETFALREDGRPSFHGHEVLGARRAERLMCRLRISRENRRRIGGLVLNHLRPGHLADAGAPLRGLRRLVREAGPDLPLLVFHAACDARASGSPDHRRRWARLLPVLRGLLELHAERARDPLPRLLGGADLLRAGIPRGPRIGRLLDLLSELQDAGEITTRRQALDWLAGGADPNGC